MFLAGLSSLLRLLLFLLPGLVLRGVKGSLYRLDCVEGYLKMEVEGLVGLHWSVGGVVKRGAVLKDSGQLIVGRWRIFSS